MMKTLIIDDDDFFRMMLVKMLSAAGYETEDGADGAFAAQKLQEGHYDIIVTDAVMILDKGMSVAEYARKHIPGTPVLIVSSHSCGKSDSEAINLSKRFGHERLQKPFKKNELFEAVKRLSCH
jgi:DNA-binding NtrC family response regulator